MYESSDAAPGKQITPHEFGLVFFIGGLALTAMVGDDALVTNALLQIITIACAHYGVTWIIGDPKVLHHLEPFAIMRRAQRRSLERLVPRALRATDHGSASFDEEG